MSLLSRLAVAAAKGYGALTRVGSPTNVSVDYLVVAGGGGGGSNSGGGAGAGGYQTSTFTLSTLNTYSITVGAGGSGGASGGNNTGSNGSDSIISGTGLTTLTSTGGGGGGKNAASPNGSNGGSGGGGGSNGATLGTGGTGVSGQGFAGGTGATDNATYRNGGGGGGASAVGANGTLTAGGAGGAGSASSISGSSVTYAGGGGGASFTTGGAGGTGGGGSGTGGVGGAVGGSGTTNTGGGGGGGAGGNGAGGAGGSGIVIISYTSATPKFVGGTITTSGGKQIHTFTSSGTLSPITPITASYLVVAGGGSGGVGVGGGGGAGGLQTGSTTIYSGATYVVTVGAGGAGITTNSVRGNNGSNSVLSGTGLTTLTSVGGGGGTGQSTSGSGLDGGSGGGGARNNTSGGLGTSGQGNNGGTGSGAASAYGGGGGGGAGAVGGNGSGTAAGNGGIGVQSSISGTATYYAGGGGGGSNSTAGTGGLGGGSDGTSGSGSSANGTPNTGGGSGATGSTSAVFASGNGGSGVVIISYAGSQQFNGGLVTSSGGNTIHTFTSTGALTPLTNNLTNSLRFRNSASASITRTPTVAGNRRTFTWSAWVKRGLINAGTSPHQFLFSASTSTTFSAIDLYSNNIRVNFGNGTYLLVTNQVFRDPSAWYHIVLSVDTTQATDANRVKLYINGNQASFASGTYPTQNYDTSYNNTVAHRFGVNDASDYFDGYLADFNFIDGQALEPYYFGNNDANGVWKPIQYKGTYGTNGFYLTFGNTTSTTTLGYDSSPNGNNWTTNGISLTAGNTYDAMTDVPTNTSATVANYCTLNPLIVPKVASPAVAVINEGNLAVYNSGASNWLAVGSTIGVTSGKWYWEVTPVGTLNGVAIGIHKSDTYFGSAIVGYSGDPDGYAYLENGNKVNNSTGTAYGATYASGNVIGVALDMDAGTLTYYKNNTSQGTAFTGLSGSFMPASSVAQSCTLYHNFGQRPFAYTPPTGYVALNTYNLPTPTILQGNKYMDATLYTQNGAASNVIVNAGQFKPDLVWIKNRDTAGTWNNLVDSVRGASKTLYSNATNAEGTDNFINTFNSNGFTLNIGDSGTNNTAGRTQVAWNWQAGQGSTSTNTSGSITSTVSVNTTAGFSIVTYTGNGSSGDIGHGLGVAPKIVLVKNRTTGATQWVFFTSIVDGSWDYLLFNSTAAKGDAGETAPTSTTFNVASSSSSINTNGDNYVAYCWAEIAGYSKFGSYTGNGSTDGSFIYLGFRPKFVLFKNITTAGYSWQILDTSRNTYNTMNAQLFPNSSAAEDTTNVLVDYLSNGIKLRNGDGAQNLNSNTYIYMAFAENPFKNANAR